MANDKYTSVALEHPVAEELKDFRRDLAKEKREDMTLSQAVAALLAAHREQIMQVPA